MAVGIIVGVFVALFVGAVTGGIVLQTPETGVFEGIVAGICAAWPFCHQGGVDRYNFLHPVPRRYKVPMKHVFGKIRQLISDKTYNFGDKWHVSTADTMQRRITATLRFTEEESHLEGTSMQSMHMKTQRKQRLIEVDVQMKEEPDDQTVVQFDFRPKSEGMAWYACDSIISGLVTEADQLLGYGTDAGDPADTRLPAPPWWLIGIAAFGLLVLFSDVMRAVFKQ